MNQSLSLIKQMGVVTALLVSTLVISNPASALITTIGNTVNDGDDTFDNGGQSFINDPSGTNATINLNTWTFGFLDTESQSTAVATTLTIYNSAGNGGTLVGISTSTSPGNPRWDLPQ
jgi:hypothetical protein